MFNLVLLSHLEVNNVYIFLIFQIVWNESGALFLKNTWLLNLF
jgi:hypothetical protein